MIVEVSVNGGEYQSIELEVAATEYNQQLEEIDILLQAMYPNSELIVRNIEE